LAFASLDDLRSVPLPLRKTASAILTEARVASAGDVFLSHSHLDDDSLAHLIALLEDCGADVRVDRKEANLLTLSGSEAAPLVREQIQSSPKLVVALTMSIVASRWMPWEIGLADGMHGVRNVALFPLRAPNVAAVPVEKEYLAMYPTIQWESLTTGYTGYCVSNPENGQFWTLKQWLGMKS
jgi:hypothetical protein